MKKIFLTLIILSLTPQVFGAQPEVGRLLKEEFRLRGGIEKQRDTEFVQKVGGFNKVREAIQARERAYQLQQAQSHYAHDHSPLVVQRSAIGQRATCVGYQPKLASRLESSLAVLRVANAEYLSKSPPRLKAMQAIASTIESYSPFLASLLRGDDSFHPQITRLKNLLHDENATDTMKQYALRVLGQIYLDFVNHLFIETVFLANASFALLPHMMIQTDVNPLERDALNQKYLNIVVPQIKAKLLGEIFRNDVHSTLYLIQQNLSDAVGMNGVVRYQAMLKGSAQGHPLSFANKTEWDEFKRRVAGIKLPGRKGDGGVNLLPTKSLVTGSSTTFYKFSPGKIEQAIIGSDEASGQPVSILDMAFTDNDGRAPSDLDVHIKLDERALEEDEALKGSTLNLHRDYGTGRGQVQPSEKPIFVAPDTMKLFPTTVENFQRAVSDHALVKGTLIFRKGNYGQFQTDRRRHSYGYNDLPIVAPPKPSEGAGGVRAAGGARGAGDARGVGGRGGRGAGGRTHGQSRGYKR